MTAVAKIRDRIHSIFPPGSLRRRFAKGVFWSSLGAGLSQAIALLASIFTARILGRTLLGELGVINSTVGLVGVVAGLGLGATATRYVALLRGQDPARAGRVMAMTTVLAFVSATMLGLLLLAVANPLADRVLSAPHLVNEIRLSSLVLVFSTLSGTQSAALLGFEAFSTHAITSAVQATLVASLSLAGAWFGDIAGAVMGQALAWFLACVVQRIAILNVASQHRVQTSLAGWKSELPVLFSFGIPAMLAALVGPPVSWIANAMLVNTPGGYEAMGVFVAASQWRSAIEFLPGLVGRVSLPMMSERLSGNDTRGVRRVLLASVLTILAVTVPVACVLGFASPVVMSFYGEGFSEGWPVMVIMLLVAVLNSVANPVGNAIVASGRLWIGVAMNAGWAAVLIGMTFFTRYAGALGLAIAWLTAYTVHLSWSAAYARVTLKGKVPL